MLAVLGDIVTEPSVISDSLAAPPSAEIQAAVLTPVAFGIFTESSKSAKTVAPAAITPDAFLRASMKEPGRNLSPTPPASLVVLMSLACQLPITSAGSVRPGVFRL